MKNSIILAGVAALALSVPTFAQPGKGNGGGGGGGQAKAERGGGGGGGQPKAERGGGGGGGGQPKAERGGGGARAERGNGGGFQKAERGNGSGQMRVERARDQRDNRGQARDLRRVEARQDRGDDRIRGGRDRGERRVDRQVRDFGNDRDGRVVRDGGGQDYIRTARSDRGDDYFRSPAFRTTGLIGGCPPGLAAKNNGCLPPGQAKKLIGGAVPAALGAAYLPGLYRSWYPDNDDYFYREADGYVYRIDRDRNLVDGYFPLYDDWNGSYYVGTAYPGDYLDTYNVPVQYQPWYADGGEDYYRYGDGAIYQVDRDGGLIEGIVALLAGDLTAGQPLPAGYDVYNVPADYRDRYADSDESWYRYNDGHIYEVDPTTRLVQAIVATLV